MKLDAAIKHYHAIEEQHTEYLFSAHFSKNKIPTVDKPVEHPQDLWTSGLKVWGKEWTDREYELRVTSQTTSELL